MESKNMRLISKDAISYWNKQYIPVLSHGIDVLSKLEIIKQYENVLVATVVLDMYSSILNNVAVVSHVDGQHMCLKVDENHVPFCKVAPKIYVASAPDYERDGASLLREINSILILDSGDSNLCLNVTFFCFKDEAIKYLDIDCVVDLE